MKKLTSIRPDHEQIIRMIVDYYRPIASISDIVNSMLVLLFMRRMECLFAPFAVTASEIYNKYRDVLDENDLDKKIREQLGNPRFYRTKVETYHELFDKGTNVSAPALEHYLETYDPETCALFKSWNAPRSIIKLLQYKKVYYIIDSIGELDFNPEKWSNDRFEVFIKSIIDLFYTDDSPIPGLATTSEGLSKIMSELLFANETGNRQVSLYDPACGLGSTLRTASSILAKKQCDSSVYGQELHNFGMINILLSKVNSCSNGHFRVGNTIAMDQFEDMTFDYVISDLPFGQYYTTAASSTDDPRFVEGLMPRTEASLLFIQHIVYKILNTKGRAVVTCPLSIFNTEDFYTSRLRLWLVEKDYVDSIVLMPGGLLSGTNIPCCLLVLDLNKCEARKDKIQIINAESLFVKARRNIVVGEDSILRISALYTAFDEVEGLSHIATISEFLRYSLVVCQPEYDNYNNIIFEDGKKKPDTRKSIKVYVPFNEQDFIGYVKSHVLDHLPKDAWIDYTSLLKTCIIDIRTPFQSISTPIASIEELEKEAVAIKNKIKKLFGQILSDLNTPLDNYVMEESARYGIKTCLFNTIARIQRSKANKNYITTEAGKYPILTIKNLRTGNDDSMNYASDSSFFTTVEDGDIIMIEKGENAGEILRARKGCLGSTMFKIEIQSDIVDKDYLYFILKSVESDIKSSVQGTSIKNVRVGDINSLKLEIPSIEEQRKVVSLLMPKVESIDALLPLLGGEAKETMLQYRQALIEDAITSFIM